MGSDYSGRGYSKVFGHSFRKPFFIGNAFIQRIKRLRSSSPADPHTNWRSQGLFYYPLSLYFRETFGAPVRKISVDAGFSCPNVDGAVGRGGCIFCDNRSFSPSRRLNLPNIRDQIREGIARMSAHYKSSKYIAYFQPSTNTYAPAEKLERLYREALAEPGIVGLAIGTRPDTLPNDVLDLIADLSKETWVCLEIGVQTACNASLDFLNRGHSFAAFTDAAARAEKRGIRLGAHFILGIPGESHEEIIRTARLTAPLGLHSVKLHNLYVVANTPLAELYAAGKISLIGREEYIRSVVDFLEMFPPGVVVERLAGDAPRDFLVAPFWSNDKGKVKQSVEEEFRRRGTFQGAKYTSEKF